MWTIFTKEISGFFSLLIGYVVIGIFILIMGLMMWVFPDYSILYFNYASLDQLFIMAPIIFMFMIPAITMRSFSEEIQNGTLEILITKPITEAQIVLGKFFACLSLTAIALLPTLFYFYAVYQLGAPVGNIDTGAVMGSYIGLLFLAAACTSIGLFSSAISRNQIIAFLLAICLIFIFYYGFYFFSKLPIFFGKTDDIIQRIGMDFHYNSISRGSLDSRDIIYFFSLIGFFIWLNISWLKNRFF
ncbi:MAG: gliding motility-associated ABC transporter permease subunit GldF [Saprospiraceae bacterium]|nr:gliding motility-associated ABC transporter permease subunit GldF [Candidatus Vicinibacter affinis]MBP6523212.1 gliding motility-associated ABC transporter permease subunit GldF [Saprospiraceae bacterium]MBK7799172.1 gliding motility-associated ABC transporter permease subunit GldF [Candidatus Vicinibacter affinis]MBK8643473.1 gliding motility-associated ABC transporter permease subunit GldF [Candidatus Vicinibacter affinis]MBK9641856.1 gliding motility-associated ABC transporter permease su